MAFLNFILVNELETHIFCTSNFTLKKAEKHHLVSKQQKKSNPTTRIIKLVKGNYYTRE